MCGIVYPDHDIGAPDSVDSTQMRSWVALLALSVAGTVLGSDWQFLGPTTGQITGMSDPSRQPLIVSTVTNIIPGAPLLYQVFRSGDGGNTWQTAMAGLPTGAGFGPVINDPRNFNEFFLSVEISTSQDSGPHGYVYRSTDGGQSWFEADVGLNFVDYVLTFAAVDANSSTDLYATICGFNTWPLPCHIQTYLSQDQGESWNEVTNAPVNGVVRTAGSGVVYATADNHAFRSVDHGVSWQQLGGAISECGSLDALAIDLSDPDTLYAGATETRVTKVCAGMSYSNDDGANWTAVAQFLRDTRSIAARSAQVVAGAYSGSYLDWPGGVFESFDRGATWTDLEVPVPYVSQVWLGPRGFSIYAATTEGLFRITTPVTRPPFPAEPPARVTRLTEPHALR